MLKLTCLAVGLCIPMLLLSGCSSAEVDQGCRPVETASVWSSMGPVLACETGQVFSDTFIQVEKGAAYSAGRGSYK
jgi:hypothetical protein